MSDLIFALIFVRGKPYLHKAKRPKINGPLSNHLFRNFYFITKLIVKRRRTITVLASHMTKPRRIGEYMYVNS